MIGFYNYTVVLTYIGLLSSISGMLLTTHGRFKTALVCLAFSGLCDMFDGKIARHKKDRTEDEKNFGIQIDSLCDVVCFGIFPILLAYSMGMRGPVGILFLCIYGVNGVIRLGYFNVMETKRQEETDENRKHYKGLPITSIAIILPLICVIGTFCKGHFIPILYITMLVVGILFVLDFKVKKPKNITLAAFIVVVSLALMRLFHIW